MRPPNYDRFPSVAVPQAFTSHCWRGWPAVSRQLRTSIEGNSPRRLVAVETYPGVIESEICTQLATHFPGARIFDTAAAFKPAGEIDALVAPYLGGGDPVFGRICDLRLDQLLDADNLGALRVKIEEAAGIVFIVGPAAALVIERPDLLVYADMPRWEGQLRQRRNEASNLGVSNRALKASLKYKRSFFVDWRICDRWKRQTMRRWDFLLDTTQRLDPRLTSGAAHLAGLREAATRPFRVVPLFDPGPWGGQWMKEVCDLDRQAVNYAWCFDCVPEENSLVLAFGNERVEIPAINLVLAEPEALLGEAVHGRFGAEFPIRFDFLDTIDGGNLSLQVHPTTDYCAEQFGMRYTQDESYYMLATQPGAKVYLGRKAGVDRDEMFAALTAAQRPEGTFDADRYAAAWPCQPHDHFLIPAGTLHCSAAGCMVLEISATPYIFTFKLWDWGRKGLDGLPRPIHLDHGRNVIRWERDEHYARAKLINMTRPVASGPGWREERTGLHEAEFIETRRHWFSGRVSHHSGGGVNVLNLVQGDAAMVESPTGAFAPFEVHYAETFIIPAAVGEYTVRPCKPETGECATLKAFVRTQA